MKYRQKLPKEIEAKLDAYVERIKAIKWFKPAADFDRSAAERQVTVALEAFGVKASVEWRSLKTSSDWDAAMDAAWDAAWGAEWGAALDAAWGAVRDAAWDAAWDAAMDAAWDAAWDAACGAAWDAACGAAWDAAWDAAMDAAWGAAEVLAADIETFNKKYPTGAFLHLIPLWEMGLYPCGVIDGKFVIYIPEIK